MFLEISQNSQENICASKSTTPNVGNKVKGRISKRVFQESKARQIFRKTSISYPLTRTCAYQGIRNVCFSEILACFAFLKHPFWDSPFCLVTDDNTYYSSMVKIIISKVYWILSFKTFYIYFNFYFFYLFIHLFYFHFRLLNIHTIDLETKIAQKFKWIRQRKFHCSFIWSGN